MPQLSLASGAKGSTVRSGLDWAFVQRATADDPPFDVVQEFVNMFVMSELIDGDRVMLPTPLAQKLARLAQHALRYMFRAQDYLKKEIEALKGDLQRVPSPAPAAPSQATGIPCPVCGRVYKGMAYLDRHVERHHADHLAAWRSLRHDRAFDPDRRARALAAELAQVRAEMDAQTRELGSALAAMERMRADAGRAAAVKVDRFTQVAIQDSPAQAMRCEKITFDRHEPPAEGFDRVVRPFRQCRELKVQGWPDEVITDPPESAVRRIVEHTVGVKERLHLGLGANYVLPETVDAALRLDNPNYTRIQGMARRELDRQFPLPG